MRAMFAVALFSLVLTATGAKSATWDGRWRGRTDPPSNADVIIRISRGKPVFFTWNGAPIGTANVYVTRSAQGFRFSTNGGADITLTPNGPGSIRIKYWSHYLGSAEGLLQRAECNNVGPKGRCLDP